MRFVDADEIRRVLTFPKLIAGMESGIFSLELTSAGTTVATPLAAPVMPMAEMRFNDGRCDRQGRLCGRPDATS